MNKEKIVITKEQAFNESLKIIKMLGSGKKLQLENDLYLIMDNKYKMRLMQNEIVYMLYEISISDLIDIIIYYGILPL